MTSTSDTKVMWLVTGLDVDYDWSVAVCHSKDEAIKLVAKLDAEQEEQEDYLRYSYYISTVRVYIPEENKD